MTVGFYSPMPPARTGVADYSAALLEGLRRHGTVELSPGRCRVALYHLGNNQLHRDIYRRALERPGVVVLHDAVLHHFLLGMLDETSYVNEFVYNYGEWSRGTAEELWRSRASSGADHRHFEFPMLKRIAERALAVIVHNPAAARVVKQHAPQARVIEIPLLASRAPLPSESDVIRYRQRLGIAPGAFLFGVFGYLRESKRIVPVLDVFAELHRKNPQTALLLAGEFVSSDLERAVRPLVNRPGVARVAYLPEQQFWLAASAVDACINLRYPSAGETSAISIQLMAIGKPVMVSDGGEYARFPEEACVRIPPGLQEPDSLWRHMLLLTSVPGVGGAIGAHGAAHIRAHHQLEQVAQLYWETLCEFGG